MKKIVLVLVLVAVFVVAGAGTALASGVESAKAIAQAALYAHIWGLDKTSDYVLDAVFGEFVPPSTFPPAHSVPPSPIFQLPPQ